ncbi:FHA domain-containing protein [Biformimicrobium ophioploci]|uniref:FHA domain-containing protein n=1 Tax=Biformimicrobium ophioploci TaxID=3036711 RepID=A0ABQ6LYB7_9GAMM|nr:FHA domain-containing protein [Microbulbifer sp. NKW57]GMG87035.1 hypothetical protein MNKW57_13560 [Microbulbifer sp. NKW57]
MALIIEVLNKIGRVSERHRFEGESATIGRAYDNDLILGDTHLDAHHLRLTRDEEGIRLQDLDTLNGTWYRHGRARRKRVEGPRVIESGDELIIGKTHLRLVDSAAEVAPAQPLHSMEDFIERIAHPAVLTILLLLIGGTTLADNYLSQATEIEWKDNLQMLVTTFLGLAIYASVWSFLGYLVRQDSRFLAHFAIISLVALLFTGWEWLSGLLHFNFSLGDSGPTLNMLILGILLPAALWLALYLSLNLTPTWRWVVSLVVPWGFLGLGAIERAQFDSDFVGRPVYSTTLKHDSRRLRPPVSMEEFIDRSDELFDIELPEKKPKKEDKSESVAKNGAPEESEVGAPQN